MSKKNFGEWVEDFGYLPRETRTAIYLDWQKRHEPRELWWECLTPENYNKHFSDAWEGMQAWANSFLLAGDNECDYFRIVKGRVEVADDFDDIIPHWSLWEEYNSTERV